MTETSSLAIILAAGLGTRMKSAMPKVLHPVAGVPMITHAIETARTVGFDRTAVVVGPDMQAVEELVRSDAPTAQVFVQEKRLGTAHAVLAARSALETFHGDVVVLYGDTPLLRPETLTAARAALRDGADLVVLGFEASDPTGYGRLITDGAGRLAAIREERDASDAERAITLCNSGVFAFRGEIVLGLLDRIGSDNAKGEFYLTDAVELARADGLKAVVVDCAEDEVLGVNARGELARVEAILQARLRRKAMAGGTTLIAPETVFLSLDARLGRDVVIEPNVVVGPGVVIEDRATIKAFSHLERAHVRMGATVGPYARLRPGADIGSDAKVGNFVEVKNAALEDGAKVNHLTYIGDAWIGRGANVGAGTITCNYDGFAKHRTEIGEGAFIGSNSALIAPVRVGDGAYVGSGSVISKDVPDDALALTRAPQALHEGWAAKVRARRARGKGRP